jgi:hypothetical protein
VGEPKSKRKKDGNPANLTRGKRGPRRPRGVTAEQQLFCIKRGRGISVEATCALVGISYSTGFRWEKKESVQQAIARARVEFEKRLLANEVKSFSLDLEHADLEATSVASMKKPHKYRGFADKVKSIELIYRRLKAIEPNTRTTAIANAGASATVVAGDTMETRYKALWLMRKESRLKEKCEAENARPALPPGGPSTPTGSTETPST